MYYILISFYCCSIIFFLYLTNIIDLQINDEFTTRQTICNYARHREGVASKLLARPSIFITSPMNPD